jgi:hypothetical protein
VGKGVAGSAVVDEEVAVLRRKPGISIYLLSIRSCKKYCRRNYLKKKI